MPGRSHQPPAFLNLPLHEIKQKFQELDWHQRQRYNSSHAASNGAETRWARVSGTEIVERNRYANIEPWDINRVRLLVPDGACDYINASHISLEHKRSQTTSNYIATQGPKELSRGHFWHMMWNETESTGVIIMLTPTHENGKEKCFAYFPQSMDNRTLFINQQPSGAQPGVVTSTTDDHFQGTVELVSVAYDQRIRSTVRELEIRVGDEKKTVYHYLFSAWPDFEIPEDEDREALLNLINVSAQQAGGPSNPRVVHCSAGVGRSGTFIALDYLLKELDDLSLDSAQSGEDPIANTVNQLREQRMMMVQGEVQFLFLYEVMRDLWFQKHGIERPTARRVNSTDSSI